MADEMLREATHAMSTDSTIQESTRATTHTQRHNPTQDTNLLLHDKRCHTTRHNPHAQHTDTQLRNAAPLLLKLVQRRRDAATADAMRAWREAHLANRATHAARRAAADEAHALRDELRRALATVAFLQEDAVALHAELVEARGLLA